MKKLLTVLVGLMLIFSFVACGQPTNNGDEDIIGIWKNTWDTTATTVYTLEISEETWILTINENSNLSSYNGSWTRSGNTINLGIDSHRYEYGTASLTSNSLFLNWNPQDVSVLPNKTTVELTKNLNDTPETGTTLEIKNQSFTDITNVIWNNVMFENNSTEKAITIGTSKTNTVTAGTGYIYFQRKTNPIIARTSQVLTVDEGETAVFTFTDNTVIVEINNTANSGTLGSTQSTVIWWDDAEGEMQPYTGTQSDVEYYTGSGNGNVSGGLFGHASSAFYYLHAPRNGSKSLAVGGTNTAKLQLTINLTKKAKLSFWYANKDGPSTNYSTTFSINNVVQNTWWTDTNWAFLTFDLEAGENILIWEKNDGYYSSYNETYYYLSLDDILIYYTE
jgi:hypothetical protein